MVRVVHSHCILGVPLGTMQRMGSGAGAVGASVLLHAQIGRQAQESKQGWIESFIVRTAEAQ